MTGNCSPTTRGVASLRAGVWRFPFRRTAAARNHTVLLRTLLVSLGLLCAPAVGAAADYTATLKLYRSGEYAACIDAVTKAILESEPGENFRLIQIRAELELGRYADAGKTLKSALERYPGSIELRWVGRDVFRYENQPERALQMDTEIEQLVRQSPWRYSDAASRIIVGKFLLVHGADAKKVLDGTFKEAKRQVSNFAAAFLASGELALEKADFALAAQEFEQAIKINPSDPDAHFGLARAFDPSDPEKTTASIKASLSCNPNHIPSLLFLAEHHLDSERYSDAEQVLDQIATINPRHPQSAACRAILAHLRHQPEQEEQHRKAALRFWKTNPEVDHLIGKKLSQKYRFAEGAAYQRQSLAFDPAYQPAKMQLAQDLLRLGEEDEGWRLANEVYAADGYNIVAHNLVQLHDNLAQFRALEADGLLVRMEAQEADIYGPRVLDLLQRARRDLCARYEVTLDKTIVVEMFPRQQDFAIRTFGLPGGAGFLGVCFGTLITANSPASQGKHPACWESTLWHEFCHVVTLHKTHNKMPRWLSEGISVYEERRANPTWGQAINPRYRQMLLGDDLTPVSELSGAFLRPATPLHLQFAYFEASLVVEYLIETYGVDALKQILVDLGTGMTINDALVRPAGSLEEMNAGFARYARPRADAMAPDADWTEPELPGQAPVETLNSWLKQHPKNYIGLQRLARQQIDMQQWEAAKTPLEAMRQLYPGDASENGLYPMLAKAHRALHETAQERAALEKLAEMTDDNIGLLERLAELAGGAGEWEQVRQYATRWLAINPLQAAPHRLLADAAEKLHDDQTAIESCRALLLLEPVDPAELHLRLATAFQRTGDLNRARRHALLALEETPRFRPAHQRLLEIVAAIEKRDSKPASGPAADNKPPSNGTPPEARPE